MQVLVQILWLLASWSSPESTCFPNGIRLTTQGQVDSFNILYPGCTQIEGNLDINGSNIKNVDSLYRIISVGISLQIYQNDSLINLNGLRTITSVGSALLVHSNRRLSSFQGLTTLKTIGGFLQVELNDSLTSFNGMDSLGFVYGLTIRNNQALNNISALDQDIIGEFGSVEIRDCPKLSVCNVPAICSHLSRGGLTFLSENAPACNSVIPILKACNPSAVCPTGDVLLNSQQDIDDFAIYFPGCTDLSGNLTIQNNEGPIYSLEPLEQIQSIGKDLNIQYNVDLLSLNGLNSLERIGGYLNIIGNPRLKNLIGLNAVTKILSQIYVSSNDSLETLEGLDQINVDSLFAIDILQNPRLSVCSASVVCNFLNKEIVHGDFNGNAPGCNSRFEVNKSCNPGQDCPSGNLSFFSQEELNEFITAYPNCTSIPGNLQIGASDGFFAITSLAVLKRLRHIGGRLLITDNTGLKNLIGLDSLESIGDGLRILFNDSLVNLMGLGSLTSVSGLVELQSNPRLTSLAGLGNTTIDNITNLYIQGNPQLSICGVPVICDYLRSPSIQVVINGNGPGCNSLTQVRSSCGIFTCLPNGITFSSQAEVDAFPANYPKCNEIEGAVSITGSDIDNLDSLYQIERINGSLFIYSNPILSNVDGLSNLKSTLYLDIESNSLLASLHGFSGLTSVGGLVIFNSPVLTSLEGLDNIDFNTLSDIYIESNPLLSACDVLSICNFINDPVKVNYAYFNFNTTGCNTAAQIKTACGTANCPGGNLTLSTQDEVNQFSTTYKDCTVLPGDLIIDGITITNLDSLHGITTIGGQLIVQNTSLTSLRGIGAIEHASVTNLVIQNNPSLAACEVRLVCDYLGVITNTYSISGNAPTCISSSAIQNECSKTCFWDGLTLTTQAEVDAFPAEYGSCVNIPGFLFINGEGITHLDSLYNLKFLGGGLFFNTASVTNLHGLENLKTLGSSLSIRNCPQLTDISQLQGIDSIGGLLRIENTLLSNLNGLNGIKNIPASVSISSNSNLTNLSGLSSLQYVGETFTIQNNPLLTHLTGLESLNHIGLSLIILNNPSLESCAGLSSLQTIDNICRVENNPQLDSLDGFASLKTITNQLTIQNNASLKNLNSFKALTKVNKVVLVNNQQLNNIKGLENFDPAYAITLTITNSPNLAICNIKSICNYLSIVPAKNATISGNATTCTSKSNILASCASFFPVSLISFKAYPGQKKNILKWQTASEQHLEYYQVEHSPDGLNFKSLGVVPGGINSIQLQSYEFVHASPPSGVNYYRLKLVDEDGEFNYSDVVSSRGSESINIFPNPTQDKVFVRGLDSPGKVILRDMMGRILLETTLSNGGFVDLSRQVSGMYILGIESGNLIFRIVRE